MSYLNLFFLEGSCRLHGCMWCAWFGVHVEGAREASKGGGPGKTGWWTPCHVTLCHVVPIVCVVTSFAVGIRWYTQKEGTAGLHLVHPIFDMVGLGWDY